ncbi:MAG: OmpA family protein [Muribaculaceae bacterium]|nr:OmpA family protein [Muribaculaceae bacterium]
MPTVSRLRSSLTFILVLLMLSGCRTPKLSTAEAQMERGEYFEAARTYRQVYNKLSPKADRPLRAEIAFKMGECYRRLRQNERTEASMRNALNQGYPDSIALLYMARAQQAQGKYAPALRSYEEYLADVDSNSVTARVGADGCRLALRLKADPTRHKVRIARTFNSSRSDFAPMLSPDGGDLLYLTTDNEKAQGARSEITGMKRGDIWVSRKDERGEWMRPMPVDGELNTDHDEGVISFSPDGSRMYLTRAVRRTDADASVEIYTSSRSDAKWSAPVKFEITADTLSNYAHPAVSPSGRYLYFSSDMPGGSGGYDLWRIDPEHPTGSLENLGEFINTPGDEMFPYAFTDSILFFASDGHPGMGGLDLFRATLTPSGGWRVENMGSPVNSPADDFGITLLNASEGFFSSNRNDASGRDHIYSLLLPDLSITISGHVLDREEEPISGAVIRIVGNDGTNRREVSRDDGSFSFSLDRGVSYAMLAGAKGFLNARQEFTADDAEEDAAYSVDFILAPVNRPVVVDNIFYDFDRATLRPESRTALDEMARVLTDNPTITIEMSSHTDRVGSDAYNDALSLRRAQSVVDYLIKECGIAPARLSFKGYGKRRPMTVTRRLARLYPSMPEGVTLTPEYIDSLSEADREIADQINRRTEFRVISTDYLY